VGADLADALAGVHERGLVDRDLKAANVLLDRHDRPYLTDFGVARPMAATHSTTTDVVLGTPAFPAPAIVPEPRHVIFRAARAENEVMACDQHVAVRPRSSRPAQSGRPARRSRVWGMGSADGSSRGRQPSRRTVLGWAATLVGLAVGVPVVSAPAAPAALAGTAPATRPAPTPAAARTNTVALTIDDGPHPTWTPKVPDLLAGNSVYATFCLIGTQAQAYPKLVRRIVRAGHGLCNHSMTHPQPIGARSTAAIPRQILDARSAITDAAGTQPRLFRAPGGDWTPAVRDITRRAGADPGRLDGGPAGLDAARRPRHPTLAAAGQAGRHPAHPRRRRGPGPDRGRAHGGAARTQSRRAAVPGALNAPVSQREVRAAGLC
jgi:peptidoglycan/xylan/chitin deacetylase (PgdA/CDA1 family)